MSLLSVRNVHLRFGGIAALEDVSFDVEAGTTAGLIGPNGAGKTTMFNVITRLYDLDEGDVLMDGRSLLRTPPSRVIRHGIARTFQNVELFGTMTVLENVGPPSAPVPSRRSTGSAWRGSPTVPRPGSRSGR